MQIEEAEAKMALEAGENDEGDDECEENMNGGGGEDDYYRPTFINMNPLDRKYFMLESSPPTAGNGDFFYFNLCKPSEVSDLMLINAHIDAFLSILDSPSRTLYS